jgi:Uma2 family endonuclease
MRPFSVAEYHRLIQTGILTEDDPVELLEGWLITKMPRNPPHDVAVGLTEQEIRSRLPTTWITRGQSAVTTDDSEPEPDVAVVRGPLRRYSNQHPTPADTALTVEVSDSTLQRDRTIKLRLYARAGIAVYWIVNLVDRQVEVYTNPTGPVAPGSGTEPTYANRQDFLPGSAVPLNVPGQPPCLIPVQDLLP